VAVVRSGRFTYAEVMSQAEQIKARCAELRERADLPESADSGHAEDLLRELTSQWEQRCR